MTLERLAARWYSMRAFNMYMVGNPDDPKVVRLREAFARLKKVTDSTVLDLSGVLRA